MSELWDVTRSVAERGFVNFLGPRFVETVLTLIAFVLAVELLTRRRWGRYRTRTFATDVTYFLFFAAGLYAFFISGPIHRVILSAVHEHCRFLLLDLAAPVPLPLKALLFIMSIDCVEYWMHRLGHANKLYWKFHCIHHTPEQLTPLSKFRIHWVDMTVFGTVKAVPLMMLGHLDDMWMPYLPLMILQVFSHFDIDFHYGPVLGRFLVSPRYHRVHHSADPGQQNTNFGIIFSCWDYIFGTANADLTRPAAFGLREVKVPDSFARQFFFPFLLVVRSLRFGGGPKPHPAEPATN
jgi:sterol desaturase/sphingolipid hydroxylase (fatty acid hydroxylase superfamily)